MVLFTILLCTILAIALIGSIASIIAGGSILVIFGDLFVFCGIVYLLVRLITKKKK